VSDALVSVVIPTFGRWHFAGTAVEAALAQEDVEVEVVVVADGPEAERHDSTPVMRDARVRVLADPAARGVASARNRGLLAARGPWVAFLDDDDLWSPRKLAVQLAAAREAGAGFAYCSGAVIDPDLSVRWIEPAPPVADLPRHAAQNNPIPACSSNLLVRTDLARAVGFDPRLMHFADWDFAVELLERARGAMVSDVLVGYLWHDASMHVAQLAGIDAEFSYFRAKHRRRGRRLGGPSQSRWIAGNHRAAGRRGRAAAAYLRGAIQYRSAPDAARAAAVLLGERAMGAAARRRGDRAPDRPPEWLARYA
jgi:glycosyltransferase involved in cell wall biosynthesis